ncbi:MULTISPECIES: DUF3302 domain-containing protein [unclassified Bradyrhizobium]|uniref:DUF3302 domain-containing protein n=1 Tax=unclassified Bradyrhizobium TaxID=2631580 RepID=UPI002478F4C2|nr:MULTISPECIES: DUF3302 domain-containing protein [unclassified Bradyrhizobium]WGR70213.1 DUF3302 domain-containing protein [Bradyrhizobium sp. ISRA426]WGR82270.1 DUF3302 domain-containing protein [Bradyrhizobium sp. ISRA430]WGR85456.1 DUF3302 domain-containing protein [Bradyrhizobium sp. ISRA432]
MDASFGVLDAFAFVVFAVLIVVAVIIFVSLGQLPGRLARKWGHPQASAVNVAGWIGIATGGLLWPLALIWAFITPSGSAASRAQNDQNAPDVAEPEAATKQQSQLRSLPAHEEMRQ